MTRLRGSSFARDAVILSAGTAAAQIVSAAAVPLLTRLFDPSEFGRLAAFTAVSGIAATAVTLRYETTIVLPKTEQDARALLFLSLALAAVLGVPLAIVALLTTGLLSTHTVILELRGWTPAAVCSGILLACIASATAWWSRQRAYRQIAALRAGQSVTVVLMAIVVGVIGSGRPDGLLTAQLLATIIVTVVALILLVRDAPRWPGAVSLRQLAVQQRAAPKFMLPAALLDVVTLQLPILVILSRFGAESAGHFSMAWRVLGLPAAVVGAAVGQVFYQRAAADSHDTLEPIRRRFERITLILGSTCALPSLAVAIWGEELFVWALGADWAPAGVMAETLVLSVALYFVFSPTSSILLVLGKQRLLLAFGVAQALYRAVPALLCESAREYVRILVTFEVVNVLVFVAAVVWLLYGLPRKRDAA